MTTAPASLRGAGALKVERPGTRNQGFAYDEFNEQFKQQFGYALQVEARLAHMGVT